MPEGNGEGRPQQQLTTNEEPQSWYNRPHGELVAAFQGYIKHMREAKLANFGFTDTPQEVVHLKLQNEAFGKGGDLFFPVLNAWDVIAYPNYPKGSLTEQRAGDGLFIAYNHFKSTGETTAIKFSDPLQVKILDALADAANIPHGHGQQVIPIPDMFSNYPAYCMTNEYLAAARANSAKWRAEGRW
jgi:hypothetical protein